MNKDLEVIKKKYGENMAHLCRELFPTILEQEGRLPEILQNNFAPTKNLGEDIISHNYKNNFQMYLINCADLDIIRKVDTKESPDVLLNKAGYNFYECTTNEEIARFKKYYLNEELLCTFNDPERLDRNYVFFAIKKNINEIKRSEKPNREDEYGTSVISIQFMKGKYNVTSIKNRYNISVDNPDATFSNNLDNIIPGLTSSFERQYNLNISQGNVYFELPNYKYANDKRYYKYFHDINNIYYCENNILIDNDIVIRDYQMPERYIFMDNYILDLSGKKVLLYENEKQKNSDNKSEIKDGFIDNLTGFDKVDIIKDKKAGTKSLIIKKKNSSDIEIILNKNNNIIKYKNHNLVDAGNNFLRYCKELEEFDCPNMLRAGKNLLSHNKKLKFFNQPLLEEVPDGCLEYNEIIENVNVDNSKRIGDNFLNNCKKLKVFNAKEAEYIGRGLLEWNKDIEEINIQKAKNIDSYFATMAKRAKINGSNEILDLDVEEIGDGFLTHHETFKEIRLRNTKRIGSGFVSDNKIAYKVDTRDTEYIGSSFLSRNECIKEIDAHRAIEVGDDFLCNNVILENINIKNVRVVGHRFLKANEELKILEVNNLKEHGFEFIPNNRKVKINANSLTFKDKLYTNHIRKIKRTFETIKKISIYNKKSINNRQELVRGAYNGRMLFKDDELSSMYKTNKDYNERGRWK